MCGISGIFFFGNQASPIVPALTRMSWAMRSRGPDDEGYAVLPADGPITDCFGLTTPTDARAGLRPIESMADRPARLGLAHRRLSIIDLSSAAHQPMRDETGRYRLVFNGEIYNYESVRSDLIARGVKFRTKSDTEVVLNAYIEWGADALKRFNGDFALAIWDQREQKLFCARDRVGIKPFYYVLSDQHFIFGSDIKTILASGLHAPVPDPVGLPLAMTFGIATRPLTAFRGIRSLEQGHWMVIDRDGSMESQRYWRLPTNQRDTKMTPETAVELAEDQIRAAVKRRLVADVPVSTFMSGGIDSTLVTAFASKMHPGITAITLGFDSDIQELNEVEEAKATAAMHPITHVIEHVTPDSCLDDIDLWIEGYEEPAHFLAANHVIGKIVRDHGCKVALNGLGGDELFAGYTRYGQVSQWKTLRRFSAAAPILERFGGRRGLRIADAMRAKTADRFHTATARNLLDSQIRQIFSPDFLETSTPFNAADITHDLYASDVIFHDAIDAISYMDLINYVGNHHVHRVDQFLMMQSVEGRFPLLDHELIEAAATIPAEILLRGGEKKWVLRSLAKGRIAPQSLRMKKKGFGLPLAQWMKGPLKDRIVSSLDRLETREEIQPDGIRDLRRRHAQGRLSHNKIWHLVALELWFQRFIDAPQSQSTPHGL
jgi:asparagine synthase (glutamine-hydrolysing)